MAESHNVIHLRQRQLIRSQPQILPPGALLVGIDLGTTHSVVSCMDSTDKNQKPIETLSYEGSFLVPSMVYFDPVTETEYVGQSAKRFLQNAPSEVVRSTKRYLGQGKDPRINHVSQGKHYTPDEVAQKILRYLLSHPRLVDERNRWQGQLWAVITVPAHFDDAARLATLTAAEAAGIVVLRMINEPTAAALAYSLVMNAHPVGPDESQIPLEETIVVFDFGGGTFDVSVVLRRGLIFHVLASEGNVSLGGDDIDHVVANDLLTHVQPHFVARRFEQNTNHPLYQSLLVIAEKLKRDLQVQGTVMIDEKDIDGRGSFLTLEYQRETFVALAAPFIEQTVRLTERVLHAARCQVKDISRILLIGGSTRLSMVQDSLRAYFPCLVDTRIEPDLAVSWGAALQAAIIAGVTPETILVDVCSHTLGIGVVDSPEAAQKNFQQILKQFGLPLSRRLSQKELQRFLGDRILDFNKALLSGLRVAPILHRNQPLPAKKSEFFHTVYDDQPAVHVVVVQGEAETVAENRLLGSFMFYLERPCPSGSRCEIQLTYDMNGLVQVFAKQIGTKNHAIANFDSRTGEVRGWTPVATCRTFDTPVVVPLFKNRYGSDVVEGYGYPPQHDPPPPLSLLGRVWLQIQDLLSSVFTSPETCEAMAAFLERSPREILLHDVLSAERQRAALAFVEALKGFIEPLPLDQIEQNLNLALYYWHHPQDRSYDFYLIERFFQLRLIQMDFCASDHKRATLGFGHYGLVIQAQGLYEHRPPQLALASHLYQLNNDKIVNNSSEKNILNTLRHLQQEIFFLVDSWEYLNSILGLEHETHQQGVSQDVALHDIRSVRACWCLDVLGDLQEWLNKLKGTMTPLWGQDLRSEAEALAALMLAAAQKLYLPASMSRIPYRRSVLEGFYRFTQARLLWNPEDMSSRLVLSAFALALPPAQGHEQASRLDPGLWEVLEAKPYAWRLCYGPFLALKAFAWAYPRWEYETLLFLTGFCFYQKSFSECLDTTTLWEWLEGFQMQRDFLEVQQGAIPYPEPFAQGGYVGDQMFKNQAKVLGAKLEGLLLRQNETSPASQQWIQELLGKLREWLGALG